MPIIATCSHCQQKYSVPFEAVGQTKTCRVCKSTFTVADQHGHAPTLPAGSTPLNGTAFDRRNPNEKWRWIWIGAMASFLLTTLPILCVIFYNHVRPRPTTFVAPEHIGWNGSQDFQPTRSPITSGDSIYDKASENIVMIHAVHDGKPKSRGSGFILAPGNRIVTNEHVIRDANFVIVETYWGQRIPVSKTIAVDQRRDLAVLPTPSRLTNGGLQLAKRTHAIGEKVFTVGSPRDTFFSISEGVISQFSKYRNAVQVVADLHGEPGASGSPLLDTDGAVLGIVSRANESKHLVYSVGFRELAALLAENEDEPLKAMPKLSIFDLD